MPQKIIKTKSLTAPTIKVEPFSKTAPGKLSLGKKFKAVVGYDKEKRPSWFLFDAYAFWELLCRIDENLLLKNLSDKDYTANPVGKFIDKLESHWPFSNEYRKAMKKEYEEALRYIAEGKLHSL